MTKQQIQRIRSIQNSMAAQVTSCFGAGQIESLRVVVRLTMEFKQALKSGGIDNDYVGGSTFSGIDSFVSLAYAYETLDDAEQVSLVRWDRVSVSSLKQRFLRLYPKFIAGKRFEKQCRALLDLYKLQLALAAMTYGSGNPGV
jgi:hypothetical protein